MEEADFMEKFEGINEEYRRTNRSGDAKSRMKSVVKYLTDLGGWCEEINSAGLHPGVELGRLMQQVQRMRDDNFQRSKDALQALESRGL